MTELVRSLLGAGHSRLHVLRTRAPAVVGKASVGAGRLLVRAGVSLMLYPHRSERIDVPAAIEERGRRTIDIVADLVDYTGLARTQVVALIQRRHESFRAEWHGLPGALRNDEWFYLSSRTYLFANAVHEAQGLADALTAELPDSSDILDFGGGTGNLAMALAVRGHHVDFVERSALQKDFVRFRIARSGLQGHVRVLDQWMPLPQREYDVVCAFDVLEHLPALAETLEMLLAALRPGGILAESSPFIRNVSNPMHHETGEEFLDLMQRRGFGVARQEERFRLWRAPGMGSAR